MLPSLPCLPQSRTCTGVTEAQRQRLVAKSRMPPSVSMHPGLFGYLCDNSLRLTEAQMALQKEIEAMGKAVMAGSPDEAQLLAWLCELMGATRVVEIGVFRGSTTLALAQALPKCGKVYALDLSRDYMEVGQKYWELAGVSHKIDVRIGPAAASLQTLLDEGLEGCIDFAFIDADKASYDEYYELCLRLVRSGGVVAIDNVLWHGAVLDDALLTTDTDTMHIHQINRKVHTDELVTITMNPIADGLTLCRKR